MPIPIVLERGYLRLTDFIFHHMHQPRPSPERLARSRLIAHRGEHDNVTVLENTLPAFEQAVAAGVWGIEMDVRWTRDAVPVVIHDADLMRVHGVAERVDRLTWQVLRQRVPAVPGLAEVAARFGGRMHLMLEIKPVTWPDPATRSRTLQEALSPLAPVEAFHLMALAPQTLLALSAFPPRSRIAIAYHWPAGFSRWVARHQWGGVCSHFAIVHNAMIRRHHALGQCIGTGFPASRNCLYREINRGVDWIFSNNAGALQREVG